MLKAISDAGSGMYYFVENEDKVNMNNIYQFRGIVDTQAGGAMVSKFDRFHKYHCYVRKFSNLCCG